MSRGGALCAPPPITDRVKGVHLKKKFSIVDILRFLTCYLVKSHRKITATKFLSSFEIFRRF